MLHLGMPEFLDVPIHVNDPELTYHESVQFGGEPVPDIVPLVVDFNCLHSVGRARLHWDISHTVLYADLYLDEATPFLADPVVAKPACKNTDVFKAELDGVTYAVMGKISEVSILSERAVQELQEQMTPPAPDGDTPPEAA